MISVPERVKDALRDGRLLKNYRFNVLETDGTVDFTIDNDTLVYESVKFDERMCSGDTLKFGLCEGSSLEFQYFDHDNITGRQLQCFIDVQYMDADGDPAWNTIPMGFFTVKKCSRQASTGIQKVTAYNKLQSEYLDQKANESIINEFAHEDKVLMLDILETMLNGYGIKTYTKTEIVGASDTSLNTYKFPSSGYKYSNDSGDAGPFGPALLIKEGGISLQDTLYMQYPQDRSIRSKSWTFSAPTDNPIQIRFDEDLDQIEENIYNFVKSKLDQVSDYTSPYADTAYFFQQYFNRFNGFINITIDYADETSEDYSSVEYNHRSPTSRSAGTLADLNKITLSKAITFIKVVVYDCWAFGTLTNNNVAIVNDVSPHSGVSNVVSFTGSEKEYVWMDENYYYHYSTYQPPKYKSNVVNVSDILDWVHVYEVTGVDAADLVEIEPDSIQDVSLRDMQSAVYETACQFGQLSRVTDLFSGVELNHSRLLPADTLYPANDLYPGGVSETSFRAWYSKLWTDTVSEQSFRNLVITYKGLDGNNVPTDFVYETVVDPDGTTDYIMDDNWLFRNLVWTQADIETYAAAMVTKMQDIHWFPFEMWAAGLPYIETGDMIEIIAGDETHTSYVLQRQLSGIQNLQDTYINGTLDIF